MTVVEILDAPQLTVEREDFLIDRSSEGFRVRGMLVRANGEGQAAMVSPH